MPGKQEFKTTVGSDTQEIGEAIVRSLVNSSAEVASEFAGAGVAKIAKGGWWHWKS